MQWGVSRSRKLTLRYNLQYFAKGGSGGEKTEDATSKKLRDARNEGQVAKSQDITIAFDLLALFLILKYFVGFIGSEFIKVFHIFLNNMSTIIDEGFDRNYAARLISEGLIKIAVISLPIMISAFLVGIIANLAQVKWVITTKPLQPNLSKFNPLSGFKRIFSKDRIFDLIKATVKVSILGYVVYNTLKDQWSILIDFYKIDLNSAIALIGNIVIGLGIKISLIFLLIAFVDMFYQKQKFKRDMKMTKQEIKDEYKQTEGDPHVKGQIKSRMRQAAQRRMMQELPQADVVITNPTHLAVAIRYNRDQDIAPLVIAKGADFLAGKIKQIASENEIEIVENKPLARMLYYNVEIGMAVPPELYQTVAEVLAYVYGLKGQTT